MENRYRIVCPFSFDFFDGYWRNFRDSGTDEPVMRLSLEAKNVDLYGAETLPIYDGGKAFRVSDSVLCVNRDFTEGKICGNSDDIQGIYGCAMVALYGNLIRRDTLVMHSSMIECNGEAILFTGPSGVGKTTQAELWNEHRGARIVNGDMVFIHKDDDGRFYACGSPWHGSSEYCLNVKLPIKAIVTPIKSDECRIEAVSGMEMLRRVFPEAMLPDWFNGCKELGMSTLDGLLKSVPVYKLECTKDIRAVEALEKKLG